MSDQAATWKLTIEDEEGPPRTLTLAPAKAYVLGRSKACDICLADRNISRRHAKLAWREGEGWRLEDTGSRFGTFLNGLRVKAPAALASGSCLQIGDVVLMLLADELGASATDLSPTATLVRAAKSAPDRLLVIKGPQAGREVPLDRGIVTLGGDTRCTVRFDEPAFAGTQLLVRALAKGRYEVLRKGSLRLYVGIRRAEQRILSDSDLLLLEDERDQVLLEMRFLSEGKGLPTYPGTPLPVCDLPWLGAAAADLLAPGKGPRVNHDAEGRPTLDDVPTPDATARAALLTTEPVSFRADTIPDPPSERWMREGIDGPSNAQSPPSPSKRARHIAVAAMLLGPGLFLAALGVKRVWSPPEANAGATASTGAPLSASSGAVATSPPPSGVPSGEAGSTANAQTPRVPGSASSTASSASTAHPSAAPSGPKRPAKISTSARPTAGGTAATGGTSEPSDPFEASVHAEAALRKRVWSGKASADEVRTLRSLCADKGDRACYDRASDLLEKGAGAP